MRISPPRVLMVALLRITFLPTTKRCRGPWMYGIDTRCLRRRLAIARQNLSLSESATERNIGKRPIKSSMDDRIVTPLTLVDVGSSGGIAPHWRAVKDLTVVEFEPDARAADPVRDWPAKRVLLRTPLWECAGEMDFYLTEKQQASSLFRPNRELLSDTPNPTA